MFVQRVYHFLPFQDCATSSDPQGGAMNIDGLRPCMSWACHWMEGRCCICTLIRWVNRTTFKWKDKVYGLVNRPSPLAYMYKDHADLVVQFRVQEINRTSVHNSLATKKDWWISDIMEFRLGETSKWWIEYSSWLMFLPSRLYNHQFPVKVPVVLCITELLSRKKKCSYHLSNLPHIKCIRNSLFILDHQFTYP